MTSTKDYPTVGIVIPAAGRGTRAGKGCQKAYRRLAGDTVLNRVLKLFRRWSATCPIVIVHHPDDEQTLEASIDRDSNIHTTTGGEERQASVLAGLRFVSQLTDSPSHVFIHDAARPFASSALLDSIWAEFLKDPFIAVIPAIAVADTLKKTDSNGLITDTVPREGLFRAQTPQAFDLPTILHLHEQAALTGVEVTDDASLFEKEKFPVRVIPGEAENTKLTFAADFEQAERFLQTHENTSSSNSKTIPDVRVGHGYDTHRLIHNPNSAITLCGVKIPHNASLLGHSDGDVGLHALTNAFLGTIAADDIGSHFPPSNPRWKGASSDVFLRHAAQLVTEAGGTITHCDVSFVCERPKISEHRDAMRDAVAGMVGIDRGRVSVKAGTNEKAGFSSVDESHQLIMNPAPFIPQQQHTFTHKTIHKATAKQQIDAAVAEGHDFYLNFLWGTHDDSLAGVDAIRYFESLKLPSVGVQSTEREQSKWDFFTQAKEAGMPLVPGNEAYPLFVKPASSYGSMFIDEHSLCRDETELENCIARLNGLMRPVRVDRAKALGKADPEGYARECESAGVESTDIVVQEFIEGEEFSVVVIAMGESPAPLPPQRAKYKQGADNSSSFLTLDLKFDSESGYELMSEDEDPELYRHLQETAVEAFRMKEMHTSGMGCDVDMRIGKDGRAYVIEVDPLPVFFYPAGSQLEDIDVKETFPGSYRGVVNTYITNYFLRNPGQRGARFTELAALFDGLPAQKSTAELDLPGVPYQGTVLDLGCGTGAVGNYLQRSPENKISHLIGVDIASKVLGTCRHTSLYNDLIHDRMEVYLSRQTDKVDHIFCISALDYLPVEELDFVLARCFQLSRRSITLAIGGHDDAPSPLDEYRMDHTEAIETFQVPPGWIRKHLSGPDACPKGQRLFYFERAN
ncbi:2-C-methyl-D-erythritol 4-phosphate cytidylyltransferase-domain-containing protein [Aspergillus karnatakaensis]|uniref:2-C-methyl-D-erythritol 4-phosphate cytidylyltransferase-domain-containing protein n=1 Tax=Aspergillus karnatakaensis TaxID=1810916 RepID=UPI003CCE13ED